ncbi:MAG: AAA family ATPase [Thiotrichales bacterium]
MRRGELTFFCGKMGAGKSRLAREKASEAGAVLICEDEWLASLYPGQITSVKDYVEYSSRLKPLLETLIQSVLIAGGDVVMDFPANTKKQREWFRKIISQSRAPHKLIYLNVSNDVCLKQIQKRRAAHPERAQTDTPEMFERVTKHFVAPDSAEGFNVIKFGANASWSDQG